jgi:ligand-binding sensor domain-containing protein
LEYSKDSWNEYDIPNQLSFCYPSDFVIIDNLVIGKDGSIWIGCRCKLLHFDGKTWTTYSNENGVAEGDISDLALDNFGNLWVATHKGNLSKYNGKQWTIYNESNTTKLVDINAILALPDGTLWLGGYKGVSRFDGNKWITYEHRAEHWFIGANVLASFTRDSVWTFGTENYYFDGRDWFPIDDFGRAIITSALAISDTDVWVGTLKGLFHFNGKDWTKILDLEIESIVHGQDGRTWIGTRKGLYLTP